MNTAENYLQSALDLVESNNIKNWVKTEHNYPIWIKLAENAVNKNTDVIRFSTYIVCVAIGG